MIPDAFWWVGIALSGVGLFLGYRYCADEYVPSWLVATVITMSAVVGAISSVELVR